MKVIKLTQRKLKGLLDYNPKTGIFTWKIKPAKNIKAGNVAGCIDNRYGYVCIRINTVLYLAHRLAFLYVEGYFPEHEIDHKNRNGSDNHWGNLREVSHQCNLRNTGNRIDSTSGVKGVHWFKQKQKWLAHIMVTGIHKRLGIYEDFNDAVLARLAAERELNWSGCDSSSPAYQYAQKNIRRERRRKDFS